MIPNQVTIKAGGTVNFMIAGFHVVAVYDDGTQPGSINTGITSPPINATIAPIIEDENNRIYRGIDPTAMPFLQGPHAERPCRPRVPAAAAGSHRGRAISRSGYATVICAVLPHFAMGMSGK